MQVSEATERTIIIVCRILIFSLLPYLTTPENQHIRIEVYEDTVILRSYYLYLTLIADRVRTTIKLQKTLKGIYGAGILNTKLQVSWRYEGWQPPDTIFIEFGSGT